MFSNIDVGNRENRLLLKSLSKLKEILLTERKRNKLLLYNKAQYNETAQHLQSATTQQHRTTTNKSIHNKQKHTQSKHKLHEHNSSGRAKLSRECAFKHVATNIPIYVCKRQNQVNNCALCEGQ